MARTSDFSDGVAVGALGISGMLKSGASHEDGEQRQEQDGNQFNPLNQADTSRQGNQRLCRGTKGQPASFNKLHSGPDRQQSHQDKQTDFCVKQAVLRVKYRWLTNPEDLSQSRQRSEEHTSELQSREKIVCRL